MRFDWAIKRLLRNKANFDILEGFLSELLRQDFKIKQILESEGNKETKDDKFNRVDILVENKERELAIVEIQNTREADYFQRMLYGTSKVILEHIVMKLNTADRKEYDRYIEEQRSDASFVETVKLEITTAIKSREEEIAETALSEGLAVALVSKLTGLSIREIQIMA